MRGVLEGAGLSRVGLKVSRARRTPSYSTDSQEERSTGYAFPTSQAKMIQKVHNYRILKLQIMFRKRKKAW